jgi:hypothetical protein
LVERAILVAVITSLTLAGLAALVYALLGTVL